MKYKRVVCSVLASCYFFLHSAAEKAYVVEQYLNVLSPVGSKGDMPCQVACEPNITGDKIVALLIGDEKLQMFSPDVALQGLKAVMKGSCLLSEGFIVPDAKEYDVRHALDASLFQGSYRPNIVALFLISKESVRVQIPSFVDTLAEPVSFTGALQSVVYLTARGPLEEPFFRTKSKADLLKDGYTHEMIRELFMSFVDANDYRIAVTCNADAVRGYFNDKQKRVPCLKLPNVARVRKRSGKVASL